MPTKKHTSEEIVAKLRQVDILVSQGSQLAGAVLQIGATKVTYCGSSSQKLWQQLQSSLP